jgi:hypothetical protein
MSIAGSSESDFLVRLRSGDMLILETKSQDTQQDEVKHKYLGEWFQAVNAHGGFAFSGSAPPWRDSGRNHVIWVSKSNLNRAFFLFRVAKVG